LNMADDAQYRLMLHNLRVAGDDPEKSPALYNFLRKQRKNTSQALPIMAAWVSPKTNVAKDSSTLSDINLLSAFYSKDQKTYTAVGTSSIYGGTESTTMQFTFHTEGNAPFHVSPVYKAFGSQTENWVQSTSATIPDDQKGKDVVASVLIIPTSSRLSPGGPITMTSKTLLNATDQCVTAPNYGVHQNAIKLSCPSLTKPTCINKGNVSNPIVSCYARNDTQTGECGDCNYSYGGGAHPDSLALMVSGTITFPDTITTDALGRPQGQLLMYLQQTAADGGCILESHFNKAGTLPKFVSINPENAKQLIYCFKGGDFTSGDCRRGLVCKSA